MKKNHFSHPLRLRLSLAVICAALCVLCAGLAAPPAAAYASEDTPALGESGDENLSETGETAAPALGESSDALGESAGEGATLALGESAGEQLWTNDYYRASDSSGDLSKAERNELDSICLKFMQDYHADLALVTVTDEALGDHTMTEMASIYYKSCGFGYGHRKDGFQMVYNLDTDEAVIVTFGYAQELIPEAYLSEYEKAVPRYREEYGVFGPFYATTRFLNNYMTKHHAAAPMAGKEDPSGTGETSAPALGVSGDEYPSGAGETSAPALGEGNEGSGKPAWYPVDPENFAEYHDETAPRVVDDADIFTDEEEVRMENRLSELRAELQKDIVIYTDMSAYGFGHDILAADFYDFNGYGIGDDYEGVVLFICMDPADRGWWACCTGPQTRGLYTEEVANQIDDLLYEYMSQGMYYEGVSDWIENFRRLYRNGSPYLDDWAMQDLATFERFHSEDAPRVVDEIGLFSESELPSLAKTAQDLSREYSADVVIHTALAPGTLRDEEYADRFYCFGGYGEGDEFDGIELTVFKRPGYMAYPVVTAYGKCAGKLTGTNKKRLENRCLASLESKNYRDAVLGWLEQTGHMLRTGRAPHSSFHWIVITVLAAIAGSVLGAISLARASSRMSTPAIAENADAYYVEGSLKMRRVSDTLVDTRTSRQYSPRETRSSGGSSSSGGRSSYSSSYKGSSGRSHSGSGRKF